MRTLPNVFGGGTSTGDIPARQPPRSNRGKGVLEPVRQALALGREAVVAQALGEVAGVQQDGQVRTAHRVHRAAFKGVHIQGGN